MLEDESYLDENGEIVKKGITLMNPEMVSIILCNYSKLKEEGWDNFKKDIWYLMQDFDKLAEKALAENPFYDRLIQLKVDGIQNAQIQEILYDEFGIKHSLEYISALWRNKIPKLIAAAAKDEFLNWYYLNEEKGQYKKCSRCGQIKLARNEYFSKNGTSKDGFYSICKKCRNKKK
jgi:hypothetical protein